MGRERGAAAGGGVTVWVVLSSGKIVGVYDNEAAALTHQKNLTKKWAIVSIECHDVVSL
jgi:hypothetical protein